MQFPAPGVGETPGAQYRAGGTIRPVVVNVYGLVLSRLGDVEDVTCSVEARTIWAGSGGGDTQVTAIATVAVSPLFNE